MLSDWTDWTGGHQRLAPQGRGTRLQCWSISVFFFMISYKFTYSSRISMIMFEDKEKFKIIMHCHNVIWKC